MGRRPYLAALVLIGVLLGAFLIARMAASPAAQSPGRLRFPLTGAQQGMTPGLNAPAERGAAGAPAGEELPAEPPFAAARGGAPTLAFNPQDQPRVAFGFSDADYTRGNFAYAQCDAGCSDGQNWLGVLLATTPPEWYRTGAVYALRIDSWTGLASSVRAR